MTVTHIHTVYITYHGRKRVSNVFSDTTISSALSLPSFDTLTDTEYIRPCISHGLHGKRWLLATSSIPSEATSFAK